MEVQELAAWLRLQCTAGVGRATARQLLAAFGPPYNVFTQSRAALGQALNERQVQSIQTVPDGYDALLTNTCAWLEAAPSLRRIVALDDPDYPTALLNIEDPPLLLYGQGKVGAWEQLHTARCLAVVGSRNPTPPGADNARLFSRAMAQEGWTVVSGMALGIDGAAHEGALAGAPSDQLATIAIVGTGLDRVYPKQHRALAHDIAQHGLLLSEYPLGTPPLSANFPQRNRIISGLSQGTLVVEAALQSGSLITARLALEQGKDVFAIPGSIHATQARGCHALIKQGAKLVENAQDILDELQPPPAHAPSPRRRPSAQAVSPHSRHVPEPTADPLLAALGFDPVGFDALQARTGVDTPSLQAQLLMLELQGDVTRLPGGLFQRTFRS